MPSGLEKRVEVLEKKVAILEAEVLYLKGMDDRVKTKLDTVEWDADHIGAEKHPMDRQTHGTPG